jgi:hypothetical protein
MKASRRSLPTREWNSNSCNSGLGSEVGTKRPDIASNFEPTTMDVARRLRVFRTPTSGRPLMSEPSGTLDAGNVQMISRRKETAAERVSC